MSKMEIRFDGLRNVGGLRTVNGARFGMVRNGGTRAHQGVDLYAPVGTPIFAVADGQIVQIQRNHPAYGQRIILKLAVDDAIARATGVASGSSLFVLYAHLSQISATLGKVTRGSTIGATGVSGNADQAYPHLHLEVRTSLNPGLGLGGRINPELLFQQIDFYKPFEAIDKYQRTA
jgi:murein DD-endopeptidase MepM/ murein hydrolase activator NlpD